MPASGYVPGVKRTPNPCRIGALVVTTAAVFGFGSAAQAASPPPSAGWHGRGIQRPEAHAARTFSPIAATVPASADRVRAIQRMLRQLGYRPGPVDGLLGPHTRAALQWFQIKHALSATGAADRATVAQLRDRVRRLTHAPVPGAGAGPLSALNFVPATSAMPASGGGGSSPVAPALLLLIAAALALLTLTLLTSKRRRRRPAAADVRPPAAGPRPAPEPAARPAGPADALGYASGRDGAELERSTQAIKQACSAHGWDLARLVRDSRPPADGHAPPGLAYALDRCAEERIPRLVVGRLQHAARTPVELAGLLRWCARHETDIVAVDAGLDTGTPEGRLTARCLVAVGDCEQALARRRASSTPGRAMPKGKA
jgi:hypothetical protein